MTRFAHNRDSRNDRKRSMIATKIYGLLSRTFSIYIGEVG
ncbi:hypothetical protein J2T57_002641 [Natronocella acetinitrilica]|uniref:Uncharacterized protein n=1 Tax=Natronocella acetinitrilica TaxID=414046 RepID=A0AAE3G686_9GAMM|nr:hypothetical protein [Natronocella acetinitrilica]